MVFHRRQLLIGSVQPHFVAAAPSGFAAISGAHTKVSSPNNPITTPAIDTTGATIIVVALGQINLIAICAITDSKGNTYTPLTAQTGAPFPYSRLFYCISPIVGSGHTFTADNGGANIQGGIAVQAFSGGSPVFDVENGVNSGFGNSQQPGSVTPSVNNSLIVTAVCTDNDGITFAINSGFTITDSVDTGTGGAFVSGFGLAYLVQGTAGAINPTWSWSGTGSNAMATIATFKP